MFCYHWYYMALADRARHLPIQHQLFWAWVSQSSEYSFAVAELPVAPALVQASLGLATTWLSSTLALIHHIGSQSYPILSWLDFAFNIQSHINLTKTVFQGAIYTQSYWCCGGEPSLHLWDVGLHTASITTGWNSIRVTWLLSGRHPFGRVALAAVWALDCCPWSCWLTSSLPSWGSSPLAISAIVTSWSCSALLARTQPFAWMHAYYFIGDLGLKKCFYKFLTYIIYCENSNILW